MAKKTKTVTKSKAEPRTNAYATSTLRPGLLVSLKTTISGNVKYEQQVIEAAHLTKKGEERERWETERVVSDPAEFEAAKVARGKARSLITGCCAATAFGYLCPEDRGEELAAAVVAARKVAEEFNVKAKLTRVTVNLITGRVAPDDVEAVRAINGEVRQLMKDMEAGIRSFDVKAIRDAANKARQIGSMLTPDAEARIRIAIDAARSSARTLAKAGEQTVEIVDRAAIKRITEQRTAFLDLEDEEHTVKVATPRAEGRALDLAPAA